MDKIGADFNYAIETLHKRLGANAHAIQMPIGVEDQFHGIIDLIEMKAYFYKNDIGTDIEVTDVPSEYLSEAKKQREKLIEAVAELDENIMMKYLEAKKLPLLNLKKILSATCR